MSEKLIKLGIEREANFLYFIRNGDVWRINRGSEDEKRMPQLVKKAGAKMSARHVLYLDADGDLSRVSKSASAPKPRRKNAPVVKAPPRVPPAGKVAAAKRAKARRAALKENHVTKPAAKKSAAKKSAAKKPAAKKAAAKKPAAKKSAAKKSAAKKSAAKKSAAKKK